MSALLDSLCGAARLAECAQTDTPSLYAAGDLTPADLAEIDAAYHQKKVSGGLRARDDAFACALDQQHFDALRAQGKI
jgi:hypothetical protein